MKREGQDEKAISSPTGQHLAQGISKCHAHINRGRTSLSSQLPPYLKRWLRRLRITQITEITCSFKLSD
jgi:hypothetical protein